MDCFSGHYLPDARLHADWRALAAATRISRLPPALVAAPPADPLRDEGLAYAQKSARPARAL